MKEEIEKVFTGLLSGMDKEEVSVFEKMKSEIDLTHVKDGETFDMFLNYELKKFLKGFIQQKFGKGSDIQFTLLNHQFIESHFARWIEKIEGSPCSADKSRTIMRVILRYHQTAEKIDWDYNQEYTYHLPKKIFTTHDEIFSFYESLKHLFYGNPTNYLKHLQNHLIF